MEDRQFSQEELNSIVGERLNKAKDKYTEQISELEKKIQEYESKFTTLNSKVEELNKSAADYQTQIAERDAKLKAYDTQSGKMRVANEFNLPNELANRLNGETEEEWRKDAESLQKVLNAGKSPQPLRSTETKERDEKEDSLRKLAEALAKK